MTKISIIIVSWNTSELLRQCLASLAENAPTVDFDVWVVDNASTDESARMVREEFPEVILIENDQNVGFARANNQALQKSSSEYVLLLNPDTVIKPGSIDRLLAFLENNRDHGGAGPRVLNPDGSLQLSCYPQPTLSREFWRLFHLDAVWPYGVYDMSRWDQDEDRDVDVLMGACLMARRAVLEQVGLFDETYFVFSEEVDLCHRIRAAGKALSWVPAAEIIHYGGQSTQQAAPEMFLNLYKGKLFYFRKHYGSWSAFFYKILLLMATLARLSLSPFAYLERPARRQRHLNLAQHYRRLLGEISGM